jgi:hypothetical protein
MQTASPRSIRVSDRDDLPRLFEEAGLSSGPVFVLVGGVGGLGADDEADLTACVPRILSQLLTWSHLLAIHDRL